MNIRYIMFTLALVNNLAWADEKSPCKDENDKDTKVVCEENNSGLSPISRQDSMQNGFELTAGTDKKNLSFKYTPINGENGFSITATAPLGDDGINGKLFDTETDAFANSATLTLNFRKAMLVDVASPRAMLGVITACQNKPSDFGLTTSAKCQMDIHELAKKLIPEANTGTLGDHAKAIVAQAEGAFYFFGGTTTYGRKEFSFFKNDSLDTQENTENPWGVSFYISRIVPMGYTLTASFEYQKGYKSASSVTRCPLPTDGQQTVDCKSGSKQAPSENTNKNLKLAFRKKYSWNDHPLAIAPDITYDFEDEEYNIGFPVYIFGNSEGQLTGGIRYDFDSEETGSQYSIFVGTKF